MAIQRSTSRNAFPGRLVNVGRNGGAWRQNSTMSDRPRLETVAVPALVLPPPPPSAPVIYREWEEVEVVPAHLELWERGADDPTGIVPRIGGLIGREWVLVPRSVRVHKRRERILSRADIAAAAAALQRKAAEARREELATARKRREADERQVATENARRLTLEHAARREAAVAAARAEKRRERERSRVRAETWSGATWRNVGFVPEGS